MTPLKVVCYFASTLLSYGLYLFLICYAFQSALRFSKKYSLLLVTLGYCLGLVMDLFFFEIDAPFHAYAMLGTAIITVLDVAGALLLFRKDPLKILLGVMMLLSLHNGFMALATLLNGLHVLPVLVPGFPNLNYLLYLAATQILFLLPLLYLFCRLLHTAVETDLDVALWRVIFCLPLAYYIYGLATGISGAMTQPATCELLISTILRALFAILSYIGALKLLLYAYEKVATRCRAEVAEQQLAMAHQRYEVLARHIEETNRLLHDWRHHMLAFRDFIAREDREGMSHYLDALGAAYEVQEMPPICEKTAVDVILRHYVALARDAHIAVEHHVNLPADFPRSDLDLCVVFGNLMENALEACQRQYDQRRFIRIQVDCIGGHMLALRMENSYEGGVVEKNGCFQSSKRPGPGLGLASVRNVALQQGGSCSASAQNSVFTVEVMLNS